MILSITKLKGLRMPSVNLRETLHENMCAGSEEGGIAPLVLGPS